MILVASIEYQLSAMNPLQILGCSSRWRYVHLHIVLASVLHDEGLNLVIGTGHGDAVERDLHRNLLVTVVDVDIGIGADIHADAHQRLQHSDFHNGRILLCVVVDDMEAIVAALANIGLTVREAESVVGIEHRGVERVLVVLDGQVVDTLQPFALEEVVVGSPVGVAGFQMTGKAMIVVRQLIETDLQAVGTSQFDDGQRLKVIVGNDLQALDVGHLDTVPRHHRQRHQQQHNQ